MIILKKDFDIFLNENKNGSYTNVESKYRYGEDTEMHCEDKSKWDYSAPHEFSVVNKENGNILSEIKFQRGPIKEVGRNGISDEDLLIMVALRLKHFQETDYACYENATAIEHILKALDSLSARRKRRKSKNIDSTSIIDYLSEHLRRKNKK